MNRSLRIACALSLAAASFSAAEGDARAEDEVQDGAINVLVLRENGSGSAASAQKYIDDVMATVARLNAWPAVHGEYFTSRSRAKTFVEEKNPHYGIVSLGAFLGMRKQAKLRVLGRASVRGGGLEQYYLVSKTATDAEGCKGQSLATNHAVDEKFVNGVIFAGQLSLADFTVEKTRRPLQTVKAVINDKSTCALIDDAQMSDLANVEGGDTLRPVWFSSKLVPMVVVAFPVASAEASEKFAASLPKVCDGDGKAACDRAGLEGLQPMGKDALKDVVAAYN